MSSKSDKNSCELAIKKTLAYRSVFKYPLSLYQLKTMLISKVGYKNKLLDQSLEHLLKRGFIKEKDKKYFLPGVNPIEWKKAKDQTKRLVGRNMQVLKMIGQIPWVKMVALTGSVAAYNTDEQSDLDTLIITGKNRLWLTRGFATLMLKIVGKFPNVDGEKGKICTNIFIDEKDLKWAKDRQNLHIAQDIVMMQPIINKGNAYFNFISANKWIFKYFANFEIAFPKESKKDSYKSFIVNWLENVVMNMQLKHMARKKTTEITTKHLIHFNKNDNSQSIMEAYEKVLVNRNIL